MTTAVVTGQRRKPSFRTIGLVMGSFVAVAAFAALAQGWSGDSSSASTVVAERAAIQEHEWLIAQALAASDQGPSVAEQIEEAIAAHSQAFPALPSFDFATEEMSAERAIAQHEALIAAWLSAGG